MTSQSSGSQPSSSQQEIDERILLDWGARIGVAARREYVKPAQLETLIASLDSVSGREALLATAAFALRQVKRGGIGQTTANLIRQALLDLYERKGADKDHARKMLGFAKWVFEADIQYRDRPENLTLHQLLKQLGQQKTG